MKLKKNQFFSRKSKILYIFCAQITDDYLYFSRLVWMHIILDTEKKFYSFHKLQKSI